MSIRFAAPPPVDDTDGDDDKLSQSTGSNSDDYPEEDNNFDDWASDQELSRPCQSLFEDRGFPTADAALDHDESVHSFSLRETCTKLGGCSLDISVLEETDCFYFMFQTWTCINRFD